MKIITPNRYPVFKPSDIFVFAAGPVQGGGDWQSRFVAHMFAWAHKSWTDTFKKSVGPLIKIVVPCRWQEHPLAHRFVDVFEEAERERNGQKLVGVQTEWETFFLNRILDGKNQGLVVFGLFPEDKNNPRRDGEAYGTNTLHEFGMYPALAASRGATNLLIADSGFPGIRPSIQRAEFVYALYGMKPNIRRGLTPEMLAEWVLDELYLRIK